MIASLVKNLLKGIVIEKAFILLLSKGRRIGEKKLLLTLLRYKFKNIPESYKTRVERADAEILLKWILRSVKSNSIEQVFST